jgi:hypothetical protein
MLGNYCAFGGFGSELYSVIVLKNKNNTKNT